MELIRFLSDFWWSWMSAMFWQVSLLIVLVGLVDMLIRNRVWPQVRHALWMLVLIKLLLPPMWSSPTAVVPRIADVVRAQVERFSGTEEQGGIALGPGAGSAAGESIPAPGGLPARASTAQAGQYDRTGTGWRVYAFGIWIAGMALFVSLLAVKIARLRRWHAEQMEKQAIPQWYHELLVQTAERMGLDRLPAIVFSDRILTPAVYGVLNPVLLLPRRYTDSLSREEAEHVLLHELAHIKRGDLWLHGLWLLLQIVYWFNPLLIFARKQIQHVREICCDLTVAALLRERTDGYRQTLLNTARELLTESMDPGLGLLGVVEEPFRLVARLRWLEKKTWLNRRPVRITAPLVLIVLIPGLLPMAGRTAQTLQSGDPFESGIAWETGLAGAATTSGTAELRLPAVHISNRAHSVRRFLFVEYAKREMGRSEVWIDGNRVASFENGLQIVVDPDRGEMLYIDHLEETYVVLPLPLDPMVSLTEEARRTQRDIRRECEVRSAGKSKKLLDRHCEKYEMASWKMGPRGAEEPIKSMVWACADLGFDWTPFQTFIENVRILYNRSSDCREELNGIRGIQMQLEVSDTGWPFEYVQKDRVVGIEREVPGPEIFAPPSGFRQEERINRLR